jgi:dTDP-4-amino-4,6-dideoxygalactose transaminase
MSPDALGQYLESCARDQATGRALGKRTGKPIKAVLPVHLYGQAADMDAISSIAARHNLLVIEDACQAHGAEYRSADGGWRRAGTFGKAAAFSFYPGKNLGSCGEGGAVTTADEQVAKTIKMLREHGQTQKYYHDLEGYNGRLHAIQAAFLRIKLRHLDVWNAERQAAAARYCELLSNIPGVVVPLEPETSRSVYHLYVIRTKDRDGMGEHLKSQGVSTGLHYPVPVHLQECYRAWGYANGSLPVTEHIAREVLSLPMFPGLTREQQRQVAAGISAFISAERTPRPMGQHQRRRA